MENNYASNSYKSKKKAQTVAPEPRAVVSGGVKVHKRSGIQKAAELFLADDISKLQTWVLDDVLIPNLKRIGMETLSTIFYGNKGGRSQQGYYGSTPKVQYDNYYGGKNTSPLSQRPTVRSSNSGFDYGELIFSNYGQAEAVLEELRAMLEQYQTVSVASMYCAAGMDYPYTYKNYGWVNLKDARIVELNGNEWALRMPRALPID